MQPLDPIESDAGPAHRPAPLFHRHRLIELLFVLLGNTVIAIVLWIAGIHGNFFEIWLISQCIGYGICFVHIGLHFCNMHTHPRSLRILSILGGAILGIFVSYLLGLTPKIVLFGTDWKMFLRIGGLALIFGGIATLFFYNLHRVDELKNAQQAAQLRALAQQKEAAIANLKLLQAQIEPHFLFNTLANLRSLIGQDDPLARTLLDRLNDYLRASLDHSRAASGTLADECRLLAAYLDIQALRMGGRLSWNIAVPEELMKQPFPPMLLQPLVENAVRHGIEPRVGPGNISLSARTENQQLVMEVRDNGRGLGQHHSGVGLSNIRERLSALHGPRAELILRENQPTGVIAELWIPLAAPVP